MIIKPAKRTLSVEEYYFSKKLREVGELSATRLAKGEDAIINLGIGSPNGMPPTSSIEALIEGAKNKSNHAYQSYVGLPEFRAAFSSWYKKYYRVELDPATEIQPLAGSKEGILLISLAFIDPGDKVLVPNPGYPTYSASSKFVGAEVISYELSEERRWEPDFDALEKMDLSGVKIMWTNYPHMPTGAAASMELYKKLVNFGKKHNILICNDNPYSFILNDKPLSILEVEGAKDVCLELNSLSKAHNMAGWRLGMVAAQAPIIKEILKVKSQMDSGMFKPLQLAAIKALEEGWDWFKDLNEEYLRRRKIAGEIFDIIGAKYDHNSSGMFLWGNVSESKLSVEEKAAPQACEKVDLRTHEEGNEVANRTPGEVVSDYLLYNKGVFITPGFIFGNQGGNYIRISLCASEEVLEKAKNKIRSI